VKTFLGADGIYECWDQTVEMAGWTRRDLGFYGAWSGPGGSFGVCPAAVVTQRAMARSVSAEVGRSSLSCGQQSRARVRDASREVTVGPGGLTSGPEPVSIWRAQGGGGGLRVCACADGTIGNARGRQQPRQTGNAGLSTSDRSFAMVGVISGPLGRQE